MEALGEPNHSAQNLGLIASALLAVKIRPTALWEIRELEKTFIFQN